MDETWRGRAMKRAATGIQWAAVWAGCAIATALTSYPQKLPGPARQGVEGAVDAVARVLLWMWDEPADGLENPGEEWAVSRLDDLSWMAGADGVPVRLSAIGGSEAVGMAAPVVRFPGVRAQRGRSAELCHEGQTRRPSARGETRGLLNPCRFSFAACFSLPVEHGCMTLWAACWKAPPPGVSEPRP